MVVSLFVTSQGAQESAAVSGFSESTRVQGWLAEGNLFSSSFFLQKSRMQTPSSLPLISCLQLTPGIVKDPGFQKKKSSVHEILCFGWLLVFPHATKLIVSVIYAMYFKTPFNHKVSQIPSSS